MKFRPPMRPWAVNDEWLFIPIAKNAHRSITRALRDSGMGTKEFWNSIPPGLKTIVMMREPIERSYSTYRMFAEHWEDKYCSFDTFIKTLLSGKSINHPKYNVEYTDPHLIPQWESMGGEMPHTLVKWDFDKLKKLLKIDELRHLGQSNPIDIDPLAPETQKLFDEFYAKDIELWNSNEPGNP